MRKPGYILRREVRDKNGSSLLNSQDGILLDRRVGRKHRFRQPDCQRAWEEVVLLSKEGWPSCQP